MLLQVDAKFIRNQRFVKRGNEAAVKAAKTATN
jgi:hypothetical protein